MCIIIIIIMNNISLPLSLYIYIYIHMYKHMYDHLREEGVVGGEEAVLPGGHGLELAEPGRMLLGVVLYHIISHNNIL